MTEPPAATGAHPSVVESLIMRVSQAIEQLSLFRSNRLACSRRLDSGLAAMSGMSNISVINFQTPNLTGNAAKPESPVRPRVGRPAAAGPSGSSQPHRSYRPNMSQHEHILT
ncbi:hypothetical protein PCANC_15292 [Puccinia coronata f. sp. avenae]|uniref:Uncharacterized protein n=1 Tax=Puccinia coronata f. sp. avenae TaxID=200324 RepID=A0A2N5UNJ1_9BASI|nr:hypothetical protein PCANC_25052 [Puccinia coronata f. sp. avenae]PLW39325.1 hypothetical protein PCANC_15292 [Puccinia coronata f. sp. avenae]